uniref:Uncharacterized protein n=1 Tax=Lepeophtheirus salmonis TaxID=72036 RepID=A0A0K2T876_LEPSM
MRKSSRKLGSTIGLHKTCTWWSIKQHRILFINELECFLTANKEIVDISNRFRFFFFNVRAVNEKPFGYWGQCNGGTQKC